MKRFSRWVSIGGKASHKRFGQTFALVAIARKIGMKCIAGFKPGMHFWHEIGLAGTREQMRLVEREWSSLGHEVKSRKPAAAFGFDLSIPEGRWAETEMAKRLEHGCYGDKCDLCDKKFSQPI